MNHRERVIASIEHRVPDKVPVDLGGDQSSIHMRAYKKLLDYLDIYDDDIRFIDIKQHIAYPCEELLERFDIDTRYLRVLGSLAGENHELEIVDGWQGEYDQFGVFWGYDSTVETSKVPYLDPVIFPLEGCETPRQIHDYDWPDGSNIDDLESLVGRARELRASTDYALVTPVIGCVYEYCTFLFGFTRAMRHLRRNPELIQATMEELLAYWTDYANAFLDAVGDNVDIACVNGDLAQQSGPIMNPRVYETLIMPLEERLSRAIHEKSSVKINYHSCGSTVQFLDFFAKIGYDIHNPVQVSAQDMDPCGLKRRFGDKITFWGGACNVQETLSFGTPRQVRENVKHNMECFKRGGGYVAANVHNITAEVPPENIVAMFDAIKELRDYKK